jgi:hypothetical protein
MFSVIIPVGPADAELDRLDDLLDSVRAHTGGEEVRIVLIDDAPRPRKLEHYWSHSTIVRTALWDAGVPDRLSAMTAGTIEALKRADGDFALKLDTDALVIGDFTSALRSVFRADSTVGVVGAFERSPDGGQRDWSMWPALIRRATWPIRPLPRAGGRLPRASYRGRQDRAIARNVIRAASSNPAYTLGAHCLGGAYAVSSSLLRHAPGWDWMPWVYSHLGEDVTLGLLCAASGLRMCGMVDQGQPFGVSWKALPADPRSLMERGHSVVHSVKDGPYGSEAELRAWFRAHAR